MVNPVPPPPAVNPNLTSHQEIKTRTPVTKPDITHPVGASQASNRPKKSQTEKDKERKKRKNTVSEDDKKLHITI